MLINIFTADTDDAIIDILGVSWQYDPETRHYERSASLLYLGPGEDGIHEHNVDFFWLSCWLLPFLEWWRDDD